MKLNMVFTSVFARLVARFSPPSTKRVYVVSYVTGEMDELGHTPNGCGTFVWNVDKHKIDLEQQDIENFFTHTKTAATVYRTEHDVPNELFANTEAVTNYLDDFLEERESPVAAVRHFT